MKLLDQFYNLDNANDLVWSLRQQGILTYVSSTKSHQLSSIKTGAFKVGLWVVLDKQFEDAEKYTKDPNHVISLKLSEEEMINLEEEAKASFSRDLSRSFTKFAN
jgi:hypothetical protein